MIKKLNLLVMAFFGGMALMSMELIFPKMSMIWFGNILTVWSANLIMALLTIAGGYALGSILLRKVDNPKIWLIFLYCACGVFFFTMPFFQNAFFEFFLETDESLGSLIAAAVFMVPSIGVLAITSPILISELESYNAKEKTNASVIFGTSTIAGVVALLIGGLFVIPYLGLTSLTQICGGFMVINVILSVILFFRK